MPCAHAEPEWCRLARNPAAYGFSGINATLDRGKDVESPEDPKLSRTKSYDINNPTVRRIVTAGTHRAMEMNIDWSATCMPGHMRRPNPKGILKSLSTLPFHFPAGLCGVKNREGLNVSGSSNTFGSMTRTLEQGVRCHPTCSNFKINHRNILDVTEHARAFGDIISIVYIGFSCRMWYA